MMTTDQRAELDAAMATIGAPICPEWTYSAVRHCQRNMDIDVSDGFNEPDRQCGGGIAQIVNAYPLLTATIDAQAAEIARLREANGILERALRTVGDDYPGSSCQKWCREQLKTARAVVIVTGAA